LAGIVFLALEISAIAWLLYWLLAGTVSMLTVAVVIGLALTATVIAWASISAGSRADTEMETFMAAGSGQNTTANDCPNTARSSANYDRPPSSPQPAPPTVRPSPVSL
jgi:hypothetical protein